ncbi:hypothetical protein OEZ85_007524 [Tetradesmus obliquus]|uniref:Uncharacterized protein n=1 Tax=Tetradesmus obliquus TaxID=3088 RepID=A0ABY8TKN5_TETOB|nr:hypothetical protein OEZ85_007524 [Tetradesmus obliquus]
MSLRSAWSRCRDALAWQALALAFRASQVCGALASTALAVRPPVVFDAYALDPVAGECTDHVCRALGLSDVRALDGLRDAYVVPALTRYVRRHRDPRAFYSIALGQRDVTRAARALLGLARVPRNLTAATFAMAFALFVGGENGRAGGEVTLTDFELDDRPGQGTCVLPFTPVPAARGAPSEAARRVRGCTARAPCRNAARETRYRAGGDGGAARFSGGRRAAARASRRVARGRKAPPRACGAQLRRAVGRARARGAPRAAGGTARRDAARRERGFARAVPPHAARRRRRHARAVPKYR